ncbi:acetyl-CoA hydrolase/transferase family protein [Paenibacillus cymbidii]|uniref:acetyl-CoA hydrolase/transferase family protein n=1 Tax=Paenibacillus cymbidii TaxID=1639034 RepID=UPI0014366FED|nr:acetyl-CoA hydrolase/transferase family protein [Paenibacillus cymbidii]
MSRLGIQMAGERLGELVKSGDHVFLPGSGCVPVGFLRQLLARKEALRDVRLCHPTAWGPFPYGKPEFAGHFRGLSFFLSANARRAWADGWGIDFVPVRLSAISALIEGDLTPVDVAVLHLSPPDERGYCSIGPYCAYMHAMRKRARLVIGQINRHMPRACGETEVHVSELDYYGELDEPLVAVPPVAFGEVEAQMARHVASLVADGDTIQIGRGGIPQAVVGELGDRRDLGVHSELISDWIVELTERGVVTGAKKSLHPGVSVATISDGSQRFYDFVHGNDAVRFMPSEYVNDPRVIALNDNLVSINTAVEVDLTGQINAESVGHRLISGTGGLLDFALGAQSARGGRFIVAMPSTALGGSASRIVAALPAGTAVTVPRTLADIVVTEYGIARLRGRTLEQRMQSLIAIAHPSFRETLEREAAAVYVRQR